MGVLMNEMDAKERRSTTVDGRPTASVGVRRGTADGGSTTDSAAGSPLGPAHPRGTASSGRSQRREPRRHTLQNGIDYNLLKQLKQLEQEKEVLLHGLDAVMATRAWYDRQLMEVQERIGRLGKANAFVVGRDQYSYPNIFKYFTERNNKLCVAYSNKSYMSVIIFKSNL